MINSNVLHEYVFFADVNEESTKELMTWVAQQEPGEPLDIYISSGGGNSWVAMAVADLLRKYENLTTHACGYVGSAGLTIFLAGNKRKIYKSCVIMTHQANMHYEKADICQYDLEARFKEMQMHGKSVTDFYCEQLGKDEKWVKKYMETKGETYYSPQEALEMGICHEII